MTSTVEAMQSATDALNANAALYAALEGRVAQREAAVISEAGLPLGSDSSLLLRAIRSGSLITFTDSGSVNAIVIASPTPHTALFRNLPFRIFPKFANTAAAVTITVGPAVGGLTAPLIRQDGTALQPADYKAGAPIDVVFDGASFRLTGLATGEVPRIVGSPTLYVRTNGNDSNDGSDNTDAKACATVQGAINKARGLYLNGRILTVQIGQPGTHAAPTSIDTGGGVIVVRGDPNSQDDYTLSGTGPAGGGNGVITLTGGTLNFLGLRFYNQSTFNHTVVGNSNSVLRFERCTWSGVGGNQSANVITLDGATAAIGAGCKCDVGMGSMFYSLGGSLSMGGVTFTFVGTPTFSTATVIASGGRVTFASGGIFSGATNGTRYTVNLNGSINTFGAGENFIPGTAAGTKYTGGQYA